MDDKSGLVGENHTEVGWALYKEERKQSNKLRRERGSLKGRKPSSQRLNVLLAEI